MKAIKPLPGVAGHYKDVMMSNPIHGADDFDFIRARLEEIRREQAAIAAEPAPVADPYCFSCGAADAEVARAGQCTGACCTD